MLYALINILYYKAHFTDCIAHITLERLPVLQCEGLGKMQKEAVTWIILRF